MNTKIVQFSVELAKKIVNGEKLGRIVTVDGTPVTILAFDLNGEPGKPIVVRGRSMLDSSKECVYEVGEDGVYMNDHDMPYADLAIEIPEAKVMTVGVDRPFDQIIPNPNHRPGVMGDYRFATKQDMEQGSYAPDKTPKDEFKAGDEVKFLHGEYKGKYGVIREVQGNGTVAVETPSGDVLTTKDRICKLSYKFKPFDKVLVSQNGWSYWIPSLFRNTTHDSKYICIDNCEYDKCIPYELKHLVKTSNDPE